MPEKYYVKSLETDTVYECTATERSNLVARGYRDVTAEQTRQQPQQAPRRATAPGPAAQNPTDTAQS